MATRGQTIKLGVFLLAALALASASLIIFGGIGLGRHGDRYTILVDDSVSGLEEGARANVMGVPVGSVSSVRLAAGGTRVIVEISLREGTRIAGDAVAYLRLQGLTQLRYVDIEQADATGAPLRPGAVIPYRQGAIDRLSDEAGRIGEKTTSALDKVDRVLDEVLGKVRGLALDEAAGALAAAHRAADEIAAAAREVRGIARDSRPSVRSALAGVEATSAEATAMFRRVDVTMSRVDDVLAELGRVARGGGADLRAALRALRFASDDVAQLSRDLRRAPSRLFLSRPAADRSLP